MNEMLSGGAIREIAAMQRTSETFRFIQEPGTGSAIMVDRDGNEIGRVGPYESSKAYSISGFCSMFARMIMREPSTPNAVITINNNCIIGVCDADKATHTGIVRMDLHPTIEWSDLCRMHEAGGTAFDQKSLIRFMRTHFHESQMYTEVCPTLRTIRFVANQESYQSVVHAKDEMSNTAKRAAIGAGESSIPEFGTLTTHRFRESMNEIAPCNIRCSIDVDIDDKSFSICPLAGEMDHAEKNAIESIADNIFSGMQDLVPDRIPYLVPGAYIDYTHITV